MAKIISILPASTSSQPATCEPCLREKKTIECDGYCTDCCENLCEDCINHHRKLKLTLEHKIVKAGKLVPLAQNNTSGMTVQKCLLHSRNEMCSFCEDHNKLCCSVCQSVDHNNCKSVFRLDEYATKAKVQDVINKLKTQLEKTKEAYTEVVKTKESAMKKLEKQKDDALKSISEICSVISTLIDKLKSKTVKNVMNCFAKATNILENTAKDCQERSILLDKHLQNLEGKSKSANEIAIFTDTKLIEQDFQKNEKDLQCFRKTQIPEIEFTENNIIVEFIKNIESLAEVRVFGEHKQEATLKIKKDTEKAKFSGCISDMAIRDDGTILTCDYHRSQLVVFDSKLNYIEQLHLPFAPTGVCVNNKSTNAVITHKTKFITVSLKPYLAVKNTTDTKTMINYNGIATQGDEIFTLHSKGPTVSVYHFDGKKDRQSSVLVSSPAGIAVSPDASWTAVSSYSDNLVIILDKALKVTRKIENLPSLEEPFSLEIDNFNRLYISIKKNVVIVTPDSKAILLDDSGRLEGWPLVKYNKTTGKLFLVTSPWNTVAIWQP